jgi:N-dimethylarginine dimethylaminohydrolase
MEKIAVETEEDYKNLISTLELFDINVVRPHIDTSDNQETLLQDMLKSKPPMNPGDDLIMLGNTLITSFTDDGQSSTYFDNIIQHVQQQGNTIKKAPVNCQNVFGASVCQLEKQTFFTVDDESEKPFINDIKKFITSINGVKEVHCMHQFGHLDGWFVPITPGLILSAEDTTRPELLALFFKTFFPDWEVLTLPPSLIKSSKFLKWKQIHSGKWWVPGHENNHNFTKFVDAYCNNWIGDTQETVHYVNTIVIDQHNVIVSEYNKATFDAFNRYNVTPHLVKLRHKTFWDGGIHCLITELDRKN